MAEASRVRGSHDEPSAPSTGRGQSSCNLGSRGGAGTPTCSGYSLSPASGAVTLVMELRQEQELQHHSPAVS